MIAQVMVVFQNGIAEARTPSLRNKYQLFDVDKAGDIKGKIWECLQMVGRNGHVLVKWNGKLYMCDMKANLKGYTRIELEYHPNKDKFSL
jgi:hypothetical protein